MADEEDEVESEKGAENDSGAEDADTGGKKKAFFHGRSRRGRAVDWEMKRLGRTPARRHAGTATRRHSDAAA